jgi:Ca2+-binding RTX toxin-like protein
VSKPGQLYKGEAKMANLLDVKLDLLFINLIEDHNMFVPLLAPLLDDLADDLSSGQITSVNLNAFNISYNVVYDPNFNALTSANPTANYITVNGNQGSNVIGGNGNDIMLGGSGVDILQGGGGTNTLWGGAGNDQLYGIYKTSVTNLDLSLFPGHELVLTIDLPASYMFGGSGNDLLVGSFATATSNFSNGMTLFGLTEGARYMYGGDGNDTMIGTCLTSHNQLTNVQFELTSFIKAGAEFMDGGAGNDFMSNDFLQCVWVYTNCSGEITHSVEGSVLDGSSGDDTLIGSFGGSRECSFNGGSLSCIDFGANSRLDGGSGNDLLIGDMQACSVRFTNGFTGQALCHFGNSILIGGTGNDKLIGDVQWEGFRYKEDALGNLVYDSNGNPTVIQGFMDATTYGGDNILFGGQGNDVLVGGNENGSAATFLGHNKFVYDGLVNNGTDTILDFNIANDTLVGQHGATFTDGGMIGGNLVVKVHDAGSSSTITLTNIHTDIFNSIMQSHAVIV